MIRKGEPSDVDNLLVMVSKFYYQTNYSKTMSFCIVTVRNLIDMLIDTGVVLVAEEEDKLVGVIGLFVSPFIFNNRYGSANEVICWVDESAQSKGLGKQLVVGAESVCKDKNIHVVQMVHLATSPPQAGQLYLSLGYEPSEFCFTKVV